MKQFVRLLNVKVNISVSQVVVDSMVTYGSNLNLMKVKDLNSLMLSLGDLFQENTLTLLK